MNDTPPIEFDRLVFDMTSWLFQRLQDEGERQGYSRATVSAKIQQQVNSRLVLEDAIDLVTGELGNGTIH